MSSENGLLILLCHAMCTTSTGITYFVLVFFHILHFRHTEIQLINKQTIWVSVCRNFHAHITLHYITFFFFLSSTTLCEFWLAQLFLSMVSFPVPSVSNYLLPSSSDRLSCRHPILILAFLSVLLRVVSIYKCF